MWKGYDIRKGKNADEFKDYLRTRNFYFEPSEDGNYIHFEVKNPDEYVDAWIRNGGKDTTKFVYEFPDGTTLADINIAKKLGLNYLGKVKHKSGIYSYFIEGTLAELKYFADEELGYELHPDYICPSDEFAGIDELIESGYFEDGKYCDKQMKLTGSKKFKDTDSDNSTVIKMCQQEIDRLIDEESSPLYDDEGEGDWSTPKGYKKQMEIDAKVTALCYVIKAYGGTPSIDPGWDGLAVNYDGPRR